LNYRNEEGVAAFKFLAEQVKEEAAEREEEGVEFLAQYSVWGIVEYSCTEEGWQA
jgi:hypothetical protein